MRLKFALYTDVQIITQYFQMDINNEFSLEKCSWLVQQFIHPTSFSRWFQYHV